PTIEERCKETTQRQRHEQTFAISNMKKVCRRKNEKEPYAAHRNAGRMIHLNESSQQNGCRNTSDARDDKPGSKIISADIGNRANQPWKQRIKHKRAVGRAVSELRDFLIIPEIPLIPYF